MIVLRILWNVLGSLKLSCAILFGMFVITWLGTLYQEQHGLFVAQKTYFESWIVWQESIPLPFDWTLRVWFLPLPGGYLLMWLLAANLLVGGMIRLRKSWSRVGILIGHIGIAVMLLAGFVKFTASIEGSVQLYENEVADSFTSYHHWEVVVTEPLDDGSLREWLVPEQHLLGLEGGAHTTFVHGDLPFDLRLSGFAANARPMPQSASVLLPVVDGFQLVPRARDKEAERNLAGCYATASPRGGGTEQAGILWAAEDAPWTVEAGSRRFAVGLRKQRFPLPFAIRLDEFHHEFHPGTDKPKLFRSDVTVIAGDELLPAKIQMNEPLRRDGFIVFQSTWGPPDARPGEPLFSGFAIVDNPSDQWPLWSCIIIGLGLLIHFGMMLARYIRAETRARA
jgi:hypothetical protein